MSCQSLLLLPVRAGAATVRVAPTMERNESPTKSTVRPSKDEDNNDVDVDNVVDFALDFDLDNIPKMALPAIQQAMKHENAVP